MTRENYFKNITVEKGDHYCMFCDNNADFVITNNNVTPKMKYSMCGECSRWFKVKINEGICNFEHVKQI